MSVLLCSIVLLWAKLPEINTMLCYVMFYRVYECSSEPGGEVGVTGWWQQMQLDGSRIF